MYMYMYMYFQFRSESHLKCYTPHIARLMVNLFLRNDKILAEASMHNFCFLIAKFAIPAANMTFNL